MNEHELLERLDERAAAAAADLRAAAARRPIPEFDTEGVRLTRLPDQSRRRFTRPLVGIAAAVVLLAGAGGWWVAMRDDSAPDQTNTPETPTPVEPRPFVATELPDGMMLTDAFEGRPLDSDQPPVGPATVYGAADAEPGLVVVVLGDWSRGDAADGAERFEVDGHEAYVYPLSTGVGTQVIVPIDGGRAVVAGGPELNREELARLAMRTAVDDLRSAVPDDALPDGWRTLLVEPDPMALISPLASFGSGFGGGPWTIYSLEGGEDFTMLGSVAGGEARMFAATLFAERVEETTVRGHRALVAHFPTPVGAGAPSGFDVLMVTWSERPGELIRLSGIEESEEELLSIAEGVRPVSADEFADLVERSALGELDADPADTVGEGTFADGSRWVLRRSDDGEFPELSVLVAVGSDDMFSESSSSSSISGTDAEHGFIAVTTVEQDDRTFAAGFVSDDVVAVKLLRLPDRSDAGNAEIATGAGHTGWVAELDAPTIVAVAVDANGDEVARTTLTRSDSSIRGESESVPYTTEMAPLPTTYVDPLPAPTVDD
ncbi:hypothetical protein BH18ACT3_BH18ACT3_18630 [soil metagenome]